MRTMMRTGFLTLAAVTGLAACAGADVVYLNNGRKIEGIVVEEKEDSIQIEIGFGKIGVKRSEINRIEKVGEDGKAALIQKWEKQKIEREKRYEEERKKEAKSPKEIMLFEEGGSFMVEAVLNKKLTVRLYLDTGAAYTAIKHSVAQNLGIDIDAIQDKAEFTTANGAKSQAKITKLASIRLGSVEALDVPIAIMDESVIDPKLKDGLLGMTFLRNYTFKIDQKHKRLILEKSE
ncbi:MAG: retropepsin-like aspartic protease [Candidatus Omnitrophica bacterium]|nr:retropepsin-like aspartic protease [Candidatus Omnitrophota bacterium]